MRNRRSPTRRKRLSHKQPAQIAVIAPFALLALFGIVGLVIDIGVFRLIDSELENAADAAALAAVWYDPVCPGDPNNQLTWDWRCGNGNPDPSQNDNSPGMATKMAQAFGYQNLGLATTLCGSTPVIDNPIVHPLQAPKARAVTVIVHCHAGYLAGRILGLGSTEITRWATAEIGDAQDVPDGNGTIRRYINDYNYTPPNAPPPLVARLVPQ